jgi:hypothetical protein
MLDLQEDGVTKKWVIITEILKEVENNNIVRLNMYPSQYVFRGVRGGEPGTRVEMVTLEIHGHIQEVVVLDVVKLTLCVYIHSFVKTITETVTFRMFEKVQTTLVTQARFF